MRQDLVRNSERNAATQSPVEGGALEAAKIDF